jgi:hypothetical protein
VDDLLPKSRRNHFRHLRQDKVTAWLEKEYPAIAARVKAVETLDAIVRRTRAATDMWSLPR